MLYSGIREDLKSAKQNILRKHIEGYFCLENKLKKMEEWTFDDFDAELNDLVPAAKKKAIEIARQLLADGEVKNQEKAIKEGIKQAKEWFLDSEG